MDPMHWHNEVNQLTIAIEPQTIVTLQQIKEQLQCSGLTLHDQQFKQQFLGLINDWMTKVMDRVQSLPAEASHGNNREEMVSAEIESEKLENECSATADLKHIESECTCAASVPEEKVVDDDMASEPVQSREDEAEKCSENILQSIIEVAVEIECEQQVLNSDNTMNCDGQSTSLNNQSTSSHIDGSADSCNALEDEHPENSSMYSSGEVSTIVENTVVMPTQIPDLLMNLNPATKTHEVSSSLKRKFLDEVDHEIEAKKHKEDDNNNPGWSVNEILFGCGHCFEAAELKLSVEEVRQHWLSIHSAELKPFQFYIAVKMRCFYCEYTASFGNLAQHHLEQHSVEPFVVVNMNDSSTCGICALSNFKASDLIEHFNTKHESVLQNSITNPIVLNDEMLTKLLANNAHRFQCGNCDRIFETQLELEFHHSIEHAGQEIAMRTIDQISESYLICDYCHAKVNDRDKYLNHIEEHCYVFKCSKCNFLTEKLMELVGHEKTKHRCNSLNYHCHQFCELLKKHFANTKIIFENGMVLFNHQLANTRFRSSHILFDIFIEELMEIIRQKYKLEHGHNDKIDAINQIEEVSNEEVSNEEVITIPMANRPPVSSRALNMKELRAQNRLINNICIYGIPYFKNENKMAIFLRMCSLIQANVDQRDIENITRASGPNALLMVKLKTFEVKQEILQCFAYNSPIWSTDLIHSPVEMPRQKVFVNIHTTKFYGKMAKIARMAMKNNKLHIYWITKYGLLVKRTRNSPDKIILSSDELLDYINKRKKSKINREKQFYQSIRWVPPKSNGD